MINNLQLQLDFPQLQKSKNIFNFGKTTPTNFRCFIVPNKQGNGMELYSEYPCWREIRPAFLERERDLDDSISVEERIRRASLIYGNEKCTAKDIICQTVASDFSELLGLSAKELSGKA